MTGRPFDADLNMGPLPNRRFVVATGPQSVRRMKYIVNGGGKVFRVHRGPREGREGDRADEGHRRGHSSEEKPQKLGFYSERGACDPASLVRADRQHPRLEVARLRTRVSASTTARRTWYVNAPAFVSEVNVDAVEL